MMDNERLKSELAKCEEHNASLCERILELTDELKLISEESDRHYQLWVDSKAEVERLRASSFVTAVPVEQYERLIKAGDAMAKNYFETYWTLYCDSETRYEPASITDWEKAKNNNL